MTNIELAHKIAQATNVKWFNEILVEFSFPYINYSLKLSGITSIYKYVDSQLAGWKGITINLPSELSENVNYFDRIRTEIIQFVDSYYQQNSLDSYWNRVVNQIKNYRYNPLPYDIPQTEFLIKIHSLNPSYFVGANYIITGTGNINVNNKDHFFGAILAYEFTLKDNTGILTRRNAEKASITKLRNDFEKSILESDIELVKHIKNLTDYSESFINDIERLKVEKSEVFDKWFVNTKDEQWEQWYNQSVKKISDLEHTYKEKLKLEEPAKYWSDRAGKLQTQGWISIGIIVILVGFTCWSLGEILWKTPDLLYSTFFNGDKSAAIRWSVVYGTLITFIAYCIRSLTKLTFSSFHLARDCQERHTLTYFYLSLIKESKVDDNDRQLIMQSLFSRADTGLLKEDSSPTMPNDIISKVITK